MLYKGGGRLQTRSQTRIKGARSAPQGEQQVRGAENVEKIKVQEKERQLQIASGYWGGGEGGKRTSQRANESRKPQQQSDTRADDGMNDPQTAAKKV